MLTFCYTCRKYTPFKVDKKKVKLSIEGHSFEIEEKAAFCEKCNQEMFVKEIEDDNYRNLDAYYREISSSVTPNEIREVLHKYDISKTNLARLLDLKDTEIYDYLDGKFPDKRVSTLIKDMKYNPSSMMKRLSDHGTNLDKTDVEVSEKAVKEVDNSKEFINDDKIEDVYFKIISLTPDITITAAMKLIYYSYGFYNAIYNEKLVKTLPSAWINGPVYPKLLHKFKKHEYRPVATEVSLDKEFKHLNEKEIEIIERVVETFGVFSGDTLTVMTKQEYPWLATRGNLAPEIQGDEPIKVEDVVKYFNEVSLKFGILAPEDISRYCEFIYSRIKK